MRPLEDPVPASDRNALRQDEWRTAGAVAHRAFRVLSTSLTVARAVIVWQTPQVNVAKGGMSPDGMKFMYRTNTVCGRSCSTKQP